LLSITGETAASPRLRVIIIQELIIQKSYVGWVVLIARWDIKIRGPEDMFCPPDSTLLWGYKVLGGVQKK
jgi:hypothetical protein